MIKVILTGKIIFGGAKEEGNNTVREIANIETIEGILRLLFAGKHTRITIEEMEPPQ